MKLIFLSSNSIVTKDIKLPKGDSINLFKNSVEYGSLIYENMTKSVVKYNWSDELGRLLWQDSNGRVLIWSRAG